MKNVLPRILIALIFNIQIAHAYPPSVYDYNLQFETSTLEIKMNGNGLISVAIDGKIFNEPVKKFSVGNVAPGNHFIEIYTEKVMHSGYYTNTQMEKVYGGNIYIQPGSFVKAVVDNFGRFYVKSVNPLMSYQSGPLMAPSPVPVYAPIPVAMSSPAFDELMRVINAQWFDESKMNVISQALQTNFFDSGQVANMMGSMSFESSKLQLAKAAYPKVVDPQSYYLVNKEFWFSSSVSELTDYILSYR